MGASGGIGVRAASLDDLDAIQALEFAAFPGDRLSRRSLRAFIGAAHRPLIVAKFGERLAGYAPDRAAQGRQDRAALFPRRRSRARAARRRPRAAAGLRALRASAWLRRLAPRGALRQCVRHRALRKNGVPPIRPVRGLLRRRSRRAAFREAPRRGVDMNSREYPAARARRQLRPPHRRRMVARATPGQARFGWRRTTKGFASRSAKEPNGRMIGTSPKTFARSPRRGAIPRTGHDRLGDSRRSCARLPQRGDAAQSHHDQRLSRAAEIVRRRGTRQDHQPLAILQLSVQGLLRLAARRGARASHHPDRRDHARTARAQALRACAARLAGGAQCRRASRAREREHDLRSPVLLRPGAGSALRGVRPAAVRLVSLPGDRGDDHAGQAVEDRPPAPAPARQTRPRGGRVLSRRAAPAHPARLAQSARARRRQIFAGGALRSARGSCRLHRWRPFAISRSSPSAIPSKSICSPSGNWRNSRNSTGCSSARRPRSTITPTASRAARCRRACRSSTIPCR